MSETTVSQSLALLGDQAVPAEVVSVAGEVTASVLGLVSSGPPAEQVAALVGGLRLLAGDGGATVIGSYERLPAGMAALANGARLRDGRQLGTPLAEISSLVVLGTLAVAEERGSSGLQVLESIGTGLEAGLRLHLCLGTAVAERGWDSAATLGRIPVVAAIGRLLGLSRLEVVSATGLVATTAAGFSSTAGTDVAGFQLGKAAADGIEATGLAQGGFTAPTTSIEGRRGLVHLLAAGSSCRTLVEIPVTTWSIASAAGLLELPEPPPSGRLTAVHEAIRGLPRAPSVSALMATLADGVTDPPPGEPVAGEMPTSQRAAGW